MLWGVIIYLGDKMDIKNFVLTYYKNAADGIHIHRVEKSLEAQKPHRHEYFQIYYIIRGRLEHFTENDKSTLSQGDMFIIPPGKMHFIREADNAQFYSFSFMRESLGEISDLNRLSINFLKKLEQGGGVRAKITVPADEMLFVEGLMEQIYKEFTEKKIGFGEVIRSCAVSLITVFARNYFAKMPEGLLSPDGRELLLHCVEYIKNNFSEKITLDEMARMSAMSKSSFCRLFSELTGTSFKKYVNDCRIRKAKEYIKKGYNITAIYGLCGYDDFTTFYRNFKKIAGISPREYKNKL